MGADSSKPIDHGDDGNEKFEDPISENQLTGIHLYRHIPHGSTGSYEVVSRNAIPRFYNSCEDQGEEAVDWCLSIDPSDVDVHVDDDMLYLIHPEQRRITFSAIGGIWALRFPSAETLGKFREELTNKLWYNEYGEENDEASRKKQFGPDFESVLFNAEANEQILRPMEEVDPDTQRGLDEEAYLKERNAMEMGDEEDEDPIDGLVMGAGENNYLIRGDRFDVLRNAEGGIEDKHVSFSFTPQSKLGNKGGASTSVLTPTRGVTPSRVMLANNESKMNLLTPDRPNSMFRADVESQKIVSTWNFNKNQVDIPMMDIVHEVKSGQLENRNTFLGFDKNRLCQWDVRDPHGIVQEACNTDYVRGKDYARGTNFTCMATTGDGCVAVGANDGKIRLYSSKSLNKANTAIPGLGAPITSLDVTFDGKWVLATTDKYIMVVKTTFTNNDKDSDGFRSQMGSKGAAPHLLRLKNEDLMLAGGAPFEKAKFTWVTEQGFKERLIVANCGKYLAIWNFNRVKGSAADTLSFAGLPTCMDYKLAPRNEKVVDAAFLHSRYASGNKSKGHDHAPLLVATPHRLTNLGY